MSGGIVQLVAVGVQDVHLTGNPEISFFRSNFKRYTHFAMSTELQQLVGTPGANGVSTIRFEKKGDLLGYVYITSRDFNAPPGGNGITRSVTDWAKEISKIELLIGGQVIDTQDVFFSNTISPSFLSSNFSQKFTPTKHPGFLPLQFFFCKDIQSVIPLVALQYHDVELRITWGGNITTGVDYRVFANFIYLDADERKYFAEKPQHDILFYQVQRVVEQPVFNQEVVFNHPVKFIAFPCIQYNNVKQTLKLQINGIDIGVEKALIHYSQVAPYYHTSFGCDFNNDSWSANPIALIPFCLDTSKLQPTGTLNFSRLDTVRLVTDPTLTIQGIGNAQSQYIYGINYNVLRISNGMAGMLYAS